MRVIDAKRAEAIARGLSDEQLVWNISYYGARPACVQNAHKLCALRAERKRRERLGVAS